MYSTQNNEEKIVKEIETYFQKGNEILGLLLISISISLFQVDNKYIILATGVGVFLFTIYFITNYYPSQKKDLEKKKKLGIITKEENKLLSKIENKYFRFTSFLKKFCLLFYAWLFFLSVFFYKLKTIC
ncbi:MAG TPA: hypothetical protein ENK22_07920, partial [Persephonella sp.]|nr:hypothetical protein [Persephonella sp.]